MRSIRLALAALLCLTGLTRDADAAVTIQLEWGACGGGAEGCSGTGTSSLTVNYLGGQTLRLDIYLTHDLPQGLCSSVFSLNFDTDLLNELNLGPMAPVEWAGTDTNPGPLAAIYGPFTAGVQSTRESSGVTAGRINSFESGTVLDPLPPNGVEYTVGSYTGTAPARYRVGQAFFTANSNFPGVDGADIFSGSFNGGFDVFVDGDNNQVPFNTIAFGTASLNHVEVIPEPGTLSLLGLGLVGLVMAARRGQVWINPAQRRRAG